MSARKTASAVERPRLSEAEHRARRATALASVIDLASQGIGLDPYREAAKIAKAIRLLAGDSAGWKLMADFARIGKPPSLKTIAALAAIYDTRAIFMAKQRGQKAVT